MAIRTVIEDGEGAVGDVAAIKLDADGKLNETTVGLVFSYLKTIVTRLNGGLTLGNGQTGHRTGNLNGQWVTVLTPPVANTEFAVPHGLGRRVIGYSIEDKDRACDVYKTSAGSWGDDICYFKCDVASATVNLWLK